MNSPIDFLGVLSVEIEDIKARREALFGYQQALPESLDDRPFSLAHRLRPLGLAFSGSGIRGATFHLGVLQGLSEIGLLPFIDYLSTVSGGGYIGCWLHGIIRNRCLGDPAAAQRELDPRRAPGAADHDPIVFLRQHSNYLEPQLGLFSTEFWTIGAVWLRNMSLNLMFLIPFLIGIVLTVLMSGILQIRFSQGLASGVVRTLWVMPLCAAVTIIGINLRQIEFSQFPQQRARVRLPDLTGRGMVGAATLCILFASYILGAFRFDPDPMAAGVILFVLFFSLQWLGGFRVVHRWRHGGAGGWPWLIAIPLVCAALTSALLWSVWRLLGTWVDPDVAWQRVALGPPMILLVWMCGAVLQIGLMGWDFPDAAREWLDRLGAAISIAMASWLGLFVLAVFGPYWLARVTLTWQPVGPALAGGWILSRIGAYLLEKSEKTKNATPGEPSDSKTRALELLAKVAPVLSLAGSLLIVSLGTHFLLRALAGAVALHSNCVVPVTGKIPAWLLWLEPVMREYWCFLFYANQALLPTGLALLAACALIVGILPLRLNINEFSMHHFDKNRLVSFYLGASRANRQPNWLTGFDPHDDFPIAGLVPSDPSVAYHGPYPIVNCALSLNTRSELAKRERSSVSFIFTPRYCGFDPPHSKDDMKATARSGDLNAEGYRVTQGYTEQAGPGLGTAMAISGAGTTPSSRRYTSKPVSFLMSILSLRLGWWLGNPRRDGPSARPGPKNALLSLLSEAFAQSSARSRYLNVSDGARFESLGLYELVRRRCRYIIVSDSEAGSAPSDEGLNCAIRKCYADFGVAITINPEPIRLAGNRGPQHCVVGTVSYPEPEAGFSADACGRTDTSAPLNATGWLLYLRAGGEPGGRPESSPQRFFEEAQFESYRQLGLQAVRTTFENVATRPNTVDQYGMLAMFQDLCRKWYPAPSYPQDKASELTALYSAFLRRIGEDAELAFLDNQLFDGMPLATQQTITPRKAVYFCIELIQFMELVYVELNFQHRGDRENPANAGWAQVFRKWANSQAVNDAWKVAGSGFSPLFQEYFEALRTSGNA